MKIIREHWKYSLRSKKIRLPAIFLMITIGLWFLNILNIVTVTDQSIGMVDVVAHIFGGIMSEYNVYYICISLYISLMTVLLFGTKWMREEIPHYEQMVLTRLESRSKWWRRYILNQYQVMGIGCLITFITVSAIGALVWGIDSVLPNWLLIYILLIFVSGYLVILGLIELIYLIIGDISSGTVSYLIMIGLKISCDRGYIIRYLSPLNYPNIAGLDIDIWNLSICLFFNIVVIVCIIFIGSFLIAHKRNINI